MAAVASRRPTATTDEALVFGDFCFSCGIATQGTPYCSQTCRQADLRSSELLSPDLSPSLSAVPALVSTKSSPASSVNNSPSPFMSSNMAGIVGVDEPPNLQLPGPAGKFEYQAGLPTSHPSFSIVYAPELAASFPAKEEEIQAPTSFDLLLYRRRSAATVPAPLYFRRSAAASQPATSSAASTTSPKGSKTSSPAPVSNDSSRSGSHGRRRTSATVKEPFSPILSPVRPARPSISQDDMASLEQALRSTVRRPSASATAQPATRPPPPPPAASRRLSYPLPDALKSFHQLGGVEEENAAGGLKVDEADEDSVNNVSAFSRYLFSHLEGTAAASQAMTRNRSEDDQQLPTVGGAAARVEPTRSLSVDSHDIASGQVSRASSMSSSRGRPGPRFLFTRGAGFTKEEPVVAPAPAAGPSTVKPEVGRAIPATIPDDDDDDEEEAPSTRVSSRSRASSPETSRARGRSVSRRMSTVDEFGTLVEAGSAGASTSGRVGRSNVRGDGSTKRSSSPVRDATRSRSRTAAAIVPGGERGRQSSRGLPPPTTRRVMEDPFLDEEDEDEDDDRGRERGRGRDRRPSERKEQPREGRSMSLLRRGRGHELVYSAGGYGHHDFDDDF